MGDKVILQDFADFLTTYLLIGLAIAAFLLGMAKGKGIKPSVFKIAGFVALMITLWPLVLVFWGGYAWTHEDEESDDE